MWNFRGGSPGLVVTGGDSSSEGCGLESQYLMDILTYIWFKYCLHENTKINEKEALKAIHKKKDNVAE